MEGSELLEEAWKQATESQGQRREFKRSVPETSPKELAQHVGLKWMIMSTTEVGLATRGLREALKAKDVIKDVRELEPEQTRKSSQRRSLSLETYVRARNAGSTITSTYWTGF